MTIASERAGAAAIPRYACAYLRVSSAKQAKDDKDGPERQQRAILDYAKRNGIEVLGWYEDSITGTTGDLERRKNYAVMLDRMRADGIKLMFVEKAERLARRLMVQEILLDDLAKDQVEVYDASGMDLSVLDGNPERVVFRQMLGMMAEYAKTVTVLRLRAARERIRAGDPARGIPARKCEGRKPYGHRDGELAILQRILRERAEGMSLDDIADGLNSDGIPSRRGKRWSRQVIGKILQDHGGKRIRRRRAASSNQAEQPQPS